MIPEPFFLEKATEDDRFSRFWEDWFLRVQRAIGFVDKTYSSIQEHTFTAIAAGVTQTMNVTITGVRVNNDISLGLHVIDAGLVYQAYAITDTVTITCTNTTAGSITPTAGSIRLTVRSF